MKLLNFNSITVQLVIFTLVISIIPASVLTYNTSNAISSMKNAQFDDNLGNLAVISEQAYNARINSDAALAGIMANDFNLASAIADHDNAAIKRLVDRYSGANQNISILDVADVNGNVITSAALYNISCNIPEYYVSQARSGDGVATTDLVPGEILQKNSVNYRTVTSGTTYALGIVCTEPIRDEAGNAIGIVYLVELLNENTDLVDKIAAVARGESTIYMGDIRVATSLKNENNVRLLGSKAGADAIAQVTSTGRSVRGYEDIDDQHLYIDYEPLKGHDGNVVGVISAGYDVNPSLAEINRLALMSIATGLILAAIAAVLGFIFIRQITRPVNRLVAAAKRVAAGELDTPLEQGRDSGEIGELLWAIRKMVDSIKVRIYYNESILKSITDPMLVIDREDCISFINKPASILTGYSLAEATGKRYIEVFRLIPANGETIYDNINKHRVVRSFEGGVMNASGKQTIVRGSCAPVLAANGVIVGTIVLLRDITKEKEADDQIRASLHEKEVLLKEIHHRVKNNLQIISSLMSLQSSSSLDPAAMTMFRESQDRIRSMALIHDRLYRSADLSHIDFGAYARSLVDNLMGSYGPSTRRIRLDIDTDNITLGVDTAVPCGLIVNELLTNAIKYAFPDGRNGEIRIGLHREDNSGDPGYRLIVADNGVGLPAGLDIEKTTTLGLQLVYLLTEQLRGKVEVRRDSGTEYIVSFKELKSRSHLDDGNDGFV